MAASKEQVLLGAFTAVESAHFYSAFLPSMMTIRKFAEDGDAVAALRRGEAIATGMTLLLGWLVSELIDTYLPLLAAVAVAVLMTTIYEAEIRRSAGAGVRAGAGMMFDNFLPGVRG